MNIVQIVLSNTFIQTHSTNPLCRVESVESTHQNNTEAPHYDKGKYKEMILDDVG
jgi:hypothetical protein